MKKYDFEGKTWTEKELIQYIKKIGAQSRIKKTVTYIAGEKNNVLDVGCGIGYFSRFLEGRYNTYTGTDIIQENIDIAKKLFKKKSVEFTTENIFSEKNERIKKNYYDYVIALELIEHVENPGTVIQKLKEFIKPKGHLIISTPNAISITNILWNFKHRNTIIKQYDFNGTQTDHLMTWDRQTLQSLLVKQGFEIIAITTSKPTITKGQSLIVKAKKI